MRTFKISFHKSGVFIYHAKGQAFLLYFVWERVLRNQTTKNSNKGMECKIIKAFVPCNLFQ